MTTSPITLPKDTSLASAASPYFTSLSRRRQQKKMSITQTYYLAHTARKKLTREASRGGPRPSIAERWFNQTVSGATKAQEESRHIQWASAVVQEPEEDSEAEDASDLDSDLSDSDDEDFDFDAGFATNVPVRRRSPSPVAPIEPTLEEDEDDDDTDSDFEYDDVEDLDELSLTRSPSRQSPPELLTDSDGESEDEVLPPSPTEPTLEAFTVKGDSTTAIPLAGDDQPHLFETGYYDSQDQTLIEAY
ncbi:hypothetical protein N7486_004066 [Penicillium sp. IBT 16267x]|nr:hypothetical protein N7486_004066 [Penicillium sp. IBT 16267x]